MNNTKNDNNIHDSIPNNKFEDNVNTICLNIKKTNCNEDGTRNKADIRLMTAVNKHKRSAKHSLKSSSGSTKRKRIRPMSSRSI